MSSAKILYATKHHMSQRGVAHVSVSKPLFYEDDRQSLCFIKADSLHLLQNFLLMLISLRIIDHEKYNSSHITFGNYILLCTISKTIKGHMIMYPFIIQSFFSFFFPFPSFSALQERVFRKRGSRGSVFGL